ncbi:pyridoxal phosphate-dependent aminotransferase, partial [Candidatus Magnetomorum sp. HK-1]
ITKQFEKSLAHYLNCKYAFAVSSGTAALHLANATLNIGTDDEVICPSLTFVAGSNTIKCTGATPVFADIESPQYLCISPEEIEKKITEKTKAIQVMHYAGYPCDMNSIQKIATKHKLFIIEDAAHAIGSEYNGKKCGTIGDIGCFSFFSNKNLSVGEGGLIVTNSSSYAERIKLMRSHGMSVLTLERDRGHAFSYDVLSKGFNYRIDEMRSAIGLIQLSKLDEKNAKRKILVDNYKKKLSEIELLSIPFQTDNNLLSFHIFTVLLNKKINRFELMSFLKKHKIQSSIHYPPIHLFSYYDQFYHKQSLPITEDVGKRVITLPLYPLMNDDDISYI